MRRSHTDEYHLPIPNDVIEVILKEQAQAINEIIDLVSDSDTEIQPMILEDIIPVLELTKESAHSLGSKEESVKEEQGKDEA